MNLTDDDFDPRKPDLALVCKDGQVVHAHSCLLMLASEPLLPAVKMAVGEAAAGGSTHSSRLAAPAGPCCTEPGSGSVPGGGMRSSRQHAEVPAGMASIAVQEDRAEAWQLLLKFLDPNQLHRPEIAWVGTRLDGCSLASCWPAQHARS